MLIEKFVFGQMAVGVFFQPDFLLVLSPPLSNNGRPEPPFGKISVHNGMYGQCEIFMLMCNNVINIFFYFIFELKKFYPYRCNSDTLPVY